MRSLFSKMTTVQSSTLIQEIIDTAKLNAGKDRVPSELRNEILPVIDVNPKHARIIDVVKGSAASTTGSTTLYTTPADADFYLVACNLTSAYNAAADSTRTSLACTIGGASKTLIAHKKISLTADAQTTPVVLPIPLKIDRNSAITLQRTFTVGAGETEANIFGYVVQNSNA